MNESITIQYYLDQVAVQSDTDALKKIYLVYQKKLHRFAMAITKNNEIAEEVVADVFINFWRHRERLLKIDNLNQYLFISTRNIAIRKISEQKQDLIDISLDTLALPTAQISQNPEKLLLDKEVLEIIEKTIASLPPRCQLVYRMAKQEGLKYKEIAAILNISVKTIDAQMAVALKKILSGLKAALKV
ncbi:MAG TPA: RNA polymerase sigma-70 factor [Niabella sp.]|nr:RNA polymerase sigma-70 factor [Niabella sp.]